ncbi:inosine-uridine nucleoside n-ribohydrolase [Stylonychia lemnae]|uniref:Inosine-uridine nucleoside n-ribohydrolase n=1 Tax=Stylonychia lemnae TaxID=5949 RepID=A0A078AT97_STYLE|nr:inosine-uridine nucleoside n-ribohydrolase [Stylonychia lemnae]|eukprot:CDW85680.1 inosine-uridine nucleoside n-ribohydrolase [Stylonychia lemnae]
MEEKTKTIDIQENYQKQDLKQSYQRPHKIIIDCDPGADDAHAIILAHYLAKVHQVEILGITTVGCNHNVDQVTKNTQIILEALHDHNIKIFKGYQKDDFQHTDFYYGPDGFGGHAHEYEENLGPIKDQHLGQENAIQFVIKAVNQYPKEITLISIGALTNIIKIHQEYPELPDMLRDVVLMGGNHKGQGNSPNWCSEFNFFQDSTAARQFFEIFKNITMISFELCHDFYPSLSVEQQSQIFDQDTLLAKMVKNAYRNSYQIEGGFYAIYDQLAVACVLEPEIVLKTEYKQVQVLDESENTRGAVIINWLDQLVTPETKKVRIITEIDYSLLVELLEDCLQPDHEIYHRKQIQKAQNQTALQTYLQALGIPKFIKLRPNFETLCLVVNKHATNIQYQNLHYHLWERKPLSFEFKDMVDRMVVQKLGGLCYEHCQLTYHVLKALGFDTRFILVQNLKNTELRFDTNVYFEHSIQIVNIEGQLYLVDNGFGAVSPRQPLPFYPSQKVQFYDFSERDKFQIFNNEDHFEVQYFENDHWRRGFGFEYPMKYLKANGMQQRYEDHIFRKKISNNRDRYLLYGKVSLTERVEVFYMRREDKFNAFLRIFRDNGYDKVFFKDYEELRDFINKEFAIGLPPREEIRDNSDTFEE